nr:MAG TPA: hypothetical protein [Crassvirales sp.]
MVLVEYLIIIQSQFQLVMSLLSLLDLQVNALY